METITTIDTYITTLTPAQLALFKQLNELIHQQFPTIVVTIFAKQPYFYLPHHSKIKFHSRPSIVLAFFNKHVNVFCQGNAKHKDQLIESGYKVTDKNTLQINVDQPLNKELLTSVFTLALTFPE